MCTDAGHEHGDIAMASPRPDLETEVLDPVSLVPADAVTLTTLVDNNSDLLLLDAAGETSRTAVIAPRAMACSPTRARSSERGSWALRELAACRAPFSTPARPSTALPCSSRGPTGDRRTLFMLVADWRGPENVDDTVEARTGQVLVVDAPASGVGWP
jgi:hypothetical protein